MRSSGATTNAGLLASLRHGSTVDTYTTLAGHPELGEKMTTLGRSLRSERIPLRPWSQLARGYYDGQLSRTTMLVGYYHLVPFVLNAFGTPFEEGAVAL